MKSETFELSRISILVTLGVIHLNRLPVSDIFMSFIPVVPMDISGDTPPIICSSYSFIPRYQSVTLCRGSIINWKYEFGIPDRSILTSSIKEVLASSS